MIIVNLFKTQGRKFPVVQWLGLGTFTAVPRFDPLVRELRSYKPHGTATEGKEERLYVRLYIRTVINNNS